MLTMAPPPQSQTIVEARGQPTSQCNVAGDGAIAHHMLIIGNEYSQKQETPCGTNEAGRWLI